MAFSSDTVKLMMFQEMKDSEQHFFYHRLNAEGQRWYDRCIPRRSLGRYEDSPFVIILKSRDDQSLINLTNMDFDSFESLPSLYKSIYDSYTIDKYSHRIRRRKVPQGRKRHLDKKGSLGMVLYYFRTRGVVSRNISLVFGVASTCISRSLCFGVCALLFTLQDIPEARFAHFS